MAFLKNHLADCHTLYVGTGERALTLPFDLICGFEISHRAPNFLTDHYQKLIFKQGVQLVDMVYLKWMRDPEEAP